MHTFILNATQLLIEPCFQNLKDESLQREMEKALKKQTEKMKRLEPTDAQRHAEFTTGTQAGHRGYGNSYDIFS